MISFPQYLPRSWRWLAPGTSTLGSEPALPTPQPTRACPSTGPTAARLPTTTRTSTTGTGTRRPTPGTRLGTSNRSSWECGRAAVTTAPNSSRGRFREPSARARRAMGPRAPRFLARGLSTAVSPPTARRSARCTACLWCFASPFRCWPVLSTTQSVWSTRAQPQGPNDSPQGATSMTTSSNPSLSTTQMIS